MEIPFASGFQWAADAATVNRFAAAVVGTGVGSIATDDPLSSGARAPGVAGGANEIALPLMGPDPGTQWCLQFWGRMPASGSSVVIIAALTDGSGNRTVHLRRSATTGVTSVFLGTSSIFSFPSTGADWAHFAVVVTEHPSTGTVECYLDDDLLATVDNLNTSRGWTANRLMLGSGSASAGNGFFTHVILTDGFRPGMDAVCDWAPPNSDETPNDWTKSNGSLDHFEHLGEVPHDGDGTYLLSENTGVGDETRHGFAVPDLTQRQVLGVHVVPVARQLDDGSDRLQTRLFSGAASPVEDVLEDWDTGYHPRMAPILTLDPDTTAEWTNAAVAALEGSIVHFGPEV